MCVVFICNMSYAKKYLYFSNREGKVLTTDGTKKELNNLTLMEWDWSSGTVKGCNGVNQLKCKEIEIEMNNVMSMEFEKQKDSDPEYIRFMVLVTMKNGAKREFLVHRVYNNGMNTPYYSFVGKSDFGIEETKIWNVKRVDFFD